MAAAIWIRRGLRATAIASPLEISLARTARNLAIPARERKLKNPFDPHTQTVEQGREYFLNNCALCHGMDGSGRTQVGLKPFAGTAAYQPDRSKVLRLASRLPRRAKARRLLEARRLYPGSNHVLLLFRLHGTQESYAGQRFRSKCHVPAWSHLFFLSRCPWDCELCSVTKARC